MQCRYILMVWTDVLFIVVSTFLKFILPIGVPFPKSWNKWSQIQVVLKFCIIQVLCHSSFVLSEFDNSRVSRQSLPILSLKYRWYSSFVWSKFRVIQVLCYLSFMVLKFHGNLSPSWVLPTLCIHSMLTSLRITPKSTQFCYSLCFDAHESLLPFYLTLSCTLSLWVNQTHFLSLVITLPPLLSGG